MASSRLLLLLQMSVSKRSDHGGSWYRKLMNVLKYSSVIEEGRNISGQRRPKKWPFHPKPGLSYSNTYLSEALAHHCPVTEENRHTPLCFRKRLEYHGILLCLKFYVIVTHIQHRYTVNINMLLKIQNNTLNFSPLHKITFHEDVYHCWQSLGRRLILVLD